MDTCMMHVSTTSTRSATNYTAFPAEGWLIKTPSSTSSYNGVQIVMSTLVSTDLRSWIDAFHWYRCWWSSNAIELDGIRRWFECGDGSIANDILMHIIVQSLHGTVAKLKCRICWIEMSPTRKMSTEGWRTNTRATPNVYHRMKQNIDYLNKIFLRNDRIVEQTPNLRHYCRRKIVQMNEKISESSR